MANHANIKAVAVDYNPFAASRPPTEVNPTDAQRALWLSCRATNSADVAHKESLTVEITGDVNDSALVRAIQTLPEFHEALRGHFRKDGQRFIIEPGIDVPVAHFDLSTMEEASWLAEVRRLVELDCASPFNLELGPLVRVTIMRIKPQLRVVVLTAHQVVCDGWSMDVLLADLGRLYSAFVGAKPLPIPPEHGFCDYLRHRDDPKTAEGVRASKTFFENLFKVTPPLPAPQSRACPTHSAPWMIAPEIVKEVKAFARRYNLSPFSVLLSAFSVLVSRIVESHDFALAIPVAGHPEVGMEDCVGPLVSLVPVRCRFAPSQSFDARCQDSYHAVLDAREHAWVDVRTFALEAQGGPTGTQVPFPSLAFSHVQKYPPGKLVFGPCQVDYQLNAPACDDFVLSLVVFEAQDSLTLDLRGKSELYSQDWLTQRLEEYERILDLACKSPGTTVESLASSAYTATSFAGDYPRGASCKYFRRQGAENQAVVTMKRQEDGPFTAKRSGEKQSDMAIGQASGRTSDKTSDKSSDKSSDEYSDQSPIIVTLQPGRADKVPLLLLFGVELYIDFAMAMTDGTPVIAMHIPILYEPARNQRPPLSDVVARYTKAVRRVCPAGPYSIAGLCFGGIVAYEVARSLRQQGEEVTFVALFDSVLPRGHHVNRRELLGHLVARCLSEPGEVLKEAAKRRVAANASWLMRLPVAEGMGHRLVTWSTGQDPTKTVDLPVLGNEARADVAKLETSRPYLDAPLFTFRATRSQGPAGRTTDPDCGWIGLARSVQSYDIESEHLNIVRWPHATVLARIIMGETQNWKVKTRC